mgnify:CR=1 FL=1
MTKFYLKKKSYSQNVLFNLLLIFLVLISLNACEDNSTKTNQTQIFVIPDSLSLNEEHSSSIIKLTSENGAELEWDVIYKPLWVELDQDDGVILNEELELEITAIPYTLMPGNYTDFQNDETISNCNFSKLTT